ncbi:hypothetical protein Ddye_023105 [Dipteronia dyeriana]|uniref:non-specific serine/threonine protein kinase n=1 Tax=Dipteronia dyeriana TaxID=168575 RepID=A0AAD9WT08_9ROSI|nr:hypothetical protein Ddye_023105 [Dipteronia dyeriana]
MVCSISYHAMAVLPWCFRLLLIYRFSSFSSAKLNANETDHLILLTIKSQLLDPLGVTSSWNNSVPLCLWTGVTCSSRHQRVIGLDLSNRKIGGRLSPFIGNLSFLRIINLDTNSFYGEIPHEIGCLFRLETLILANNSFSGTIPTNLSRCSNLITFAAYGNNLVGEIPTEIGSLLKLVKLAIGQNHLTGQVPAFVGNLTTLRRLDFVRNSLSGRIPETIGQLRALTTLNLAVNNFSGTVPPSIYNISSLTDFVLAYNSFNGILPSNIGFTLPNLEYLAIHGNNFSGSLPTSLSNASRLGLFDVGQNQFTGKVSIDFSRLKNILFLSLGDNYLGNDLEFISSLVNCSRLEQIGLENNQFGGVLPYSIANLSTKMTKLVMGRNQISGTIFPGIRNLVKLFGLGLESNRLTGMIPPEIGELKNLQALYLHSNNLHGSIPSSLGNLTILNDLQLGWNNIQGNIPSSFGNCQNLLKLVVNSNKLIGTMPREIFSITTLSLGLDLSNNLLSGPFPSEVSNLKNLVAMDISGNRFSGEIPFAIGSCTSLENLSMNGNSFSGNIPPSMSSLKGIKMLDLSSNNLSGQIPEFLENLSFLGFLNLSYNDFEGEVPTKGVFSYVTEISIIGNKRLCGGVAELHLPLCHSEVSKKKSKILLKLVIPVIASVLLLSSICFIIVIKRRRKPAQESSSMSNLEGQFPMISYAELSKATNEFSSSNTIGQGSFGLVYKGMLDEDSMLVAVKVINLQRKGASKSFMAECEALRNVRHRNLIKIITVCSSIDFKGDDFKALVYEYMQNGSLENWLHQGKDQVNVSSLSLIQRLNAAIDVASAIEYLHHDCQPPIVHGDLKPSNVLLDHDMVTHVSDFGLAKFLLDNTPSTESRTQSSSIGIKGTVGYVAPEYGMGSQLSMQGDMYSFGIFLLEMFTGKRPTDGMFHNEITLHDFTKMSLPDSVMEIAEPSLLLEVTADNNGVENFVRLHGEGRVRIEECLVGVLRIGVLCSMESPADRMEMTDVVAKLCAIRENFLHRRTGDIKPSSR